MIEAAFAIALQTAPVDRANEYAAWSAWLRCSRRSARWLERAGETVVETARLAVDTCPSEELAFFDLVRARMGDELTDALYENLRAGAAQGLDIEVAVYRACRGQAECLTFYQSRGIDALEE